MKKQITKRIFCLWVLLCIVGAALVPVFAAGEAENTVYTQASDLQGKKIGVLTGTICDRYAEENIADCQVKYFNTNADMAVALEKNLIDAYITDEPIARTLFNVYPNHGIICTMERVDYAYVFNKSRDASQKLKEQMNAFLKSSEENGRLEYLTSKWLGKYEDAKTVDLSEVKSGPNGVIKFATSTDTGVPFAYIKDGNYAGYDIDLAVEFCKTYGYGLSITDYTFSGILNAVQSGGADFGASCVTITEERKQSVDFSDANYNGGIVLVGLKKTEDTASGDFSTESLKGTTAGILSGSVFDQLAEKYVGNCKLSYYNAITDLAEALNQKKIDWYIADAPTAKCMLAQHPNQKIVYQLTEESYGFMFKKDSEQGTLLCKQFNDFLKDRRSGDYFQNLENKWFYGSNSEKTLDYSDLAEAGTNGKLVFATCTDVGEPFVFFKDGKIVGMDVEIAADFCREYGYGMELKNYSVAGILNAAVSGSVDFAASSVAITEERKESILFSEPYYDGGCVIVMPTGEQTESSGFFQSVRESFEKTFLRENRWKLFIEGIVRTMLITAVAIVGGIALGLALFLLCRKGNKIANAVTNTCFGIVQRMPVIVLLMILYYVILGKILPDGLWVSIICFTLIFTAGFYGILKAGVGAVGTEQYEAAYALGFGENETFFRVIMPQAARHFLPLLKSEIISLIKATAVVGYIAVADLTRISDIVRSRTYEAIFPLVTTAVIYFALEGLLVLAVSRMEVKTDFKRRKPEQILRGVKRK